jgi:hypothetical protein
MSCLPKPTFNHVRRSIEKSLCLLYRNDHFLITNGTEERTITHKLAEYIQQQFPEWHVDCEYNRRGISNSKDIPTQSTSYPDIIVHRRNTKDNLLVIEAKSMHSRNHDDVDDKNKIKQYIEDAKYCYSFGLWICFYDELADVRLDWFNNQAGFCRGVSL